MSMVKSQSSASTRTAEAAGGEITMLTPEEVREQVRVMRERIPVFMQLPNDVVTQKLRRKARLNPEFAREAFGAVAVSGTVQAALGNTSADLVAAEEEVTRWLIVEGELSALLSGVAAGNVVRRERIAAAATQAYNLSRQLVKQEEHADLLPHVERMKRVPKYVSARRAKAAAETQPQQSPSAKPS